MVLFGLGYKVMQSHPQVTGIQEGDTKVTLLWELHTPKFAVEELRHIRYSFFTKRMICMLFSKSVLRRMVSFW